MKVAEEIEALNVMGIDPVKYLVVPRLLSMIIMMPTYSRCSAKASASSRAGLSVSSLSWASRPDLLRQATRPTPWNRKDLLDRAAQGADVSARSSWARSACFYGMQVEGGAEGVGKNTTKSVVTCLTCMLAAWTRFSLPLVYFIL